jgi:hypothetical protein
MWNPFLNANCFYVRGALEPPGALPEKKRFATEKLLSTASLFQRESARKVEKDKPFLV